MAPQVCEINSWDWTNEWKGEKQVQAVVIKTEELNVGGAFLKCTFHF